MKHLLLIVIASLFILTTFIISNEKTKELTWELLETYHYQTGYFPKELKKQMESPIEIAGFIVPLELDGYVDTVKTFLLVPDPFSCIHVPPPPPNQMILVTMKKPIPLNMDMRGVYIHGKLSFVSDKDKKRTVGFQLSGSSAREADIEFEDPWEEFYDTEISHPDAPIDPNNRVIKPAKSSDSLIHGDY